MRLQLSSLTAVIALVVSTTAGAQDITKKPVTGADRKKATAPVSTQPTEPAAAKSSEPASATPPVVAAPTTTEPATAPPAKPAMAAPDEPAPPQSSAPGQTGMTPGQQQTSPGQASELTPAQTGTTPSGQSVPSDQSRAAPAAAATAADVKAGVSVFDQKGGAVGKIVSTTAKDAVIDTGKVKASIPISSLAKGDNGLVIGMTKAELDAAARKKSPK